MLMVLQLPFRVRSSACQFSVASSTAAGPEGHGSGMLSPCGNGGGGRRAWICCDRGGVGGASLLVTRTRPTLVRGTEDERTCVSSESDITRVSLDPKPLS